MQLWLIRHALPVRVEGVVGAADPGLAPEGHDQAERLAGWLRGQPFDAVWSSPMRRVSAEVAASSSRPLMNSAPPGSRPT